MALIFVGYDYNGQPVFQNDGGPISPTPNSSPYAGTTGSPGAVAQPGVNPSTIDPSTGQQRPVGAPNVPWSTIDPSTGLPRPVNPPAYNPIPELQGVVNDWDQQQGAADDWYTEWMRGTLNSRTQDQNNWESQVGGLVNQLPGITNQQNAARVGNTANYTSALQGYQASDQNALNTYIGANNAALGTYNQRANDLYNMSVPMISAAQSGLSTANYQTAAYQQAQQTWADYQQAQQTLAELHQYASDPRDIARQEAAVAQLGELVNGGEWNENLRGVTQKYKDLSDPEITAQERFILENFKQRREDIERNNREAVMSNLAARGMRSGAAEQTAMLNSQQEMGRQSVLNDLGAEANAVDRSQRAMQGWSQASQAGRAMQLQASGMYTDAAGNLRQMNDNVGLANTGWANQNSMFNAGQANDISMFNANAYNNNSMFNAGQANQTSQFNANAYNQNQQFNANAYNSNQQFNAGQSNAVSMFNTGQQNLIGIQNQNTYAADLTRKGDLANTQLGNNNTVNGNNFLGTIGVNATGATRAGTIHSTQQGDIDSLAGNQRGDVGVGIGFQDATRAGRNAVTDAFANVGTGLYNGVFTPTITARAGAQNALISDKYRLSLGQYG